MNKTIPKLRFKEYSEKWQTKKIGQVISIVSNKYNPIKDTASYRCVELEHLSTSSGTLLGYSDSRQTLSIKNKFTIGQVLFGKLRPYLRKFFLATFDGVCSSEIWVLEGLNLNNQFLYQIIQKSSFIELANKSTGSKMPRADWSVISNEAIAVPPSLAEQEKIASFLSAVDEKIQQLKRKKEFLEQYKKGLMQQLFSGKLRFKDNNGKDYPKWEEKRLEQVCEINPRAEKLPETFTYIDLESVVRGQLVKQSIIDRSIAPSRAQRVLKSNDILYQTVRPYQMNNYLFQSNGDFVASTGYAQIRTAEYVGYVFQLLHTEKFVGEVIEKCTGTSFPAINSKDLGSINVPIPNKEEQKKIADFLSSIDQKTEGVNRQITQTQTFKKGLLQQMFV